MATKENSTKKLTLISLVLMIFASVFGFPNMPRAFFLMGYGAIPWYMLSALTFFIPYAFMMAEYGSAFKDEKGGIYTWMRKSIGPKYAFVGVFMWYASYIVWMVGTSSIIWIPLSNAIFGSDTTSSWALFGLKSTQVIGILGILWMALITFIATKGLEKIKKITSIAGTAVAVLNVFLLIGSLLVLILNKGNLAQPIEGLHSFISSPNSSYGSPVAMLSFVVFAIFAFGGIEVVGGLVDETENAAKNFPKGIITAALIISIGYSLGIFACGIFTNWTGILSGKDVHMGNVAYILMKNLGVSLGLAMGTTTETALVIGSWVARFVGFSMFLAFTGTFFTLAFAPLKQLIEGTPKELWPAKMTKVKDGIPKNALIIQCVIVILMIMLVSFGGDEAAKFFSRLQLMTNVAMTLPNLFIAGAFIAFKNNDNIKKTFVMFKTKTKAKIATCSVLITVGFANIFTIIEPWYTKGDISSTIWMIAGPLCFTVVALIVYNRAEKKQNINNEEAA
ncbi:amino acid/polyamine/organocation transporter, APC superfamily [Clostridium cavendishii DSM 21758]|uniref:Amino acid/polyamine/organocation transporter, APC superfamily n=1 Tax=Clostridium cavendishii DSM 21758 TaxID=1121302 RepID=A0A1M6UUS2_9CLOT|nr:glutamate/gamma-aminobutyrate family transporter YjeM [Clostridium cavendishii]SHK72925.1 amino acid/polyamine/organocation transporter, APC superfamily [Clostridium cavendishii DSM 21758]